MAQASVDIIRDQKRGPHANMVVIGQRVIGHGTASSLDDGDFAMLIQLDQSIGMGPGCAILRRCGNGYALIAELSK